MTSKEHKEYQTYRRANWVRKMEKITRPHDRIVIPKGLQEYLFDWEGNIVGSDADWTMRIYAINEKNAIRKRFNLIKKHPESRLPF